MFDDQKYSMTDYRRMVYIYNAYKTGWTIRRGINDANIIISKLKLPCDDICLYFIDFIAFYDFLLNMGNKRHGR